MEGNNVFILGAGFSHGCGHPLMKDFIEEGYKAIEAFGDSTAIGIAEKFRDIKLEIKRAYDGHYAKERDLNNIEDLITLAHTGGEENKPLKGIIKDEASLFITPIDFIIYALKYTQKPIDNIEGTNFSIDQYQVYKEILMTLQLRIEDNSLQGKILSALIKPIKVPYPQLFLLLASTNREQVLPNLIVNFNYDLIIENFALNIGNCCHIIYPQLKIKFGEGRTPIYIIKPNGSANWLRCTDCGRISVYQRYVNSGDSCLYCESKHTIPYIIAPGEKAGLEFAENNIRLTEICQMAKNIGIFGYSFPQGDEAHYEEFRTGLLNSREEPPVYVFDPDTGLMGNPNSWFSDLQQYPTLRYHLKFNPFGEPVFHSSSRFEAERIFSNSESFDKMINIFLKAK